MIALLAGCGGWEYRPVGRPTTAPGVVLAAQISPGQVAVSGVFDGVDQPVDIDDEPDDRYAFRYQVVDANDDVLYERATVGPALVQSFLAYYSETSGIDILASIPELGQFALTVPVLDGGDYVRFQLRDATGAWVDSGNWSYSHLSDPRIEPEIEPESVEVLHQGTAGPANDLDLVIVSDGYTEDQLPEYHDDADKVVRSLLDVEPFRSYADRITITRVDVPSNQSGASFDCGTCGYVDNAFGSIFPIELVDRIQGGGYSTRAMFQLAQWKVAEAISGVPWDEVLVLVNSPKFGGMAVHYASVTTGVGDIGPTAVHELGHAFGMLGDEYVADACIRTPGYPLPENVTDAPEHPPWADLVDADTPLPTPPGDGYGVGAYEGAWNCPDLYRPREACRMNDGHGDFCPVCLGLLERRLMRFGDPATSVRIRDRRVVVDGALPDTEVVVRADGERVGKGPPDALPELPKGAERVEVEVTWEPGADDPTHDLTETWRFQRFEGR